MSGREAVARQQCDKFWPQIGEVPCVSETTVAPASSVLPILPALGLAWVGQEPEHQRSSAEGPQALGPATPRAVEASRRATRGVPDQPR